MAELDRLDKTYCTTMPYCITTGQASHDPWLARDLGLTMEEGRRLLHGLIGSGLPAWLHPDTDDIVAVRLGVL
jgi:hypothetical protein